LKLSELDATAGFRIDGVGAEDQSGYSVSGAGAGAGDVNGGGDGFDDLIISTRIMESSYVVFGQSGGFSSAVDLSSLNGINRFPD